MHEGKSNAKFDRKLVQFGVTQTQTMNVNAEDNGIVGEFKFLISQGHEIKNK